MASRGMKTYSESSKLIFSIASILVCRAESGKIINRGLQKFEGRPKFIVFTSQSLTIVNQDVGIVLYSHEYLPRVRRRGTRFVMFSLCRHD